MARNINLLGKRFGKLLVTECLGLRARKDGRNNKYWLCLCDCGNTVEHSSAELLSNKTKSCGCYRKEKLHNLYFKGGKSKLYDVWRMMKKRCYDEKSPHFKNYGGRGIKICPEWLGTFGYENFKGWAETHGYEEGLTIDRFDNDDGYNPQNCSWQTRERQSNNKRNNRLIEMNGEIKTLAMWCKQYDAEYSRTRYRLEHGYTLYEALTTQTRGIKKEN